jgi:hypothetical protein
VLPVVEQQQQALYRDFETVTMKEAPGGGMVDLWNQLACRTASSHTMT